MIEQLASFVAGALGALLVLLALRRPVVVRHVVDLTVDSETRDDVFHLLREHRWESSENSRNLTKLGADLGDRNMKRADARRQRPSGSARATKPRLDPEQAAEQRFREETIQNGIRALKAQYAELGRVPPPDNELREEVLDVLNDRTPL